MAISLLETTEQFQDVIQNNDSFFLLKHSITCPISAEAKQQYEQFAEQTKTPLYILHVQEARPLSNEIAETYGVKHESPQALYFKNNKIVWNASHWDVTKEALENIEEK